MPPPSASSTTNIHIDGLTTPAIGPTAPWWWQGSSGAVAQQPLGVLGRFGQALEQRRADERAAHRAGGAVPGQRRSGVQERAALDVEDLAGGADVDQVRAARRAPCDGLGVGRAAPRGRP